MEQFPRFNLKTVCEPPRQGDAHLALRTLDEADHRPVDLGSLGELLLGQPALASQFP